MFQVNAVEKEDSAEGCLTYEPENKNEVHSNKKRE